MRKPIHETTLGERINGCARLASVALVRQLESSGMGKTSMSHTLDAIPFYFSRRIASRKQSRETTDFCMPVMRSLTIRRKISMRQTVTILNPASRPAI